MAASTSNAMESLLGSTLSSGPEGATIPTKEALEGKTVALYFSAHWCPPCRKFTPFLTETYTKLKAAGKPFEVVFVSSDRDNDSFEEYFGEMPWMALPFAERDLKAKLSSQYGVSGIPSLVILDAEGKTLTTDGRDAVMADPEGFPWKPKTVHELLGDSFRRPDGTVVDKSAIEGKNIALYFSAHWCPPCRAFTPKLSQVYKDLKGAGQDLEFIFVSSDKDEGSFNEYHSNEMSFLALPFARRTEKELLSTKFGVSGIPTLVTLDASGNVINKNCRGGVDADPAAFPWPPKPCEELSTSVESNGYDINSKPALIAFVDGVTDSGAKAAAAAALLQVATEHSAAAKAAGEEPGMIFFTATANDGPVPQVKKLCSLPPAPSQIATLLILDIPDKGGYYMGNPDAVTPATINEFLAGYKSKALTRGQMNKG